ncbi:hypothetical protein HHI36_001874 [Cryptolaemus montrouzieri]|uniref:Uncharacterized protein n=1 Tax=Cryptolaemus montrouzieri TaxID=559131 RepID=A0ABD2P8U4_9CUCU
MDDMEKIINDTEIVFNEVNLNFTDLSDENEIRSLNETINRMLWEERLMNSTFLARRKSRACDKRKKDPSVITSELWQEYLSTKAEKRAKMEEEKRKEENKKVENKNCKNRRSIKQLSETEELSSSYDEKEDECE